MENKRLFRTVKRFNDPEKFIRHVLSFLRFYQVPTWWTKASLKQYWEEYHNGLFKRV